MQTILVNSRVRLAVLALGALLVGAGPTQAQQAQPAQGQLSNALFASMRTRNIGPAGMSGRIAAVEVDPADDTRIFVGASSGGVWLSENGGITWEPIFDDQPTQSIGDVVVSAANPDLIWVGTGEGNPRQSVSVGRGVFRSMDGGRSWQQMGLTESEHITRMRAHPTNPDVLYVAAMGQIWLPQGGGEKGVYRTEDRGRTWQRVLEVNPHTGAADLAMDPRNPEKLFAAMYEVRRTPWLLESGGVGSGLYMTRDGGDSWQRITEAQGMPPGPYGRIGVAIAPSNPNVVYAIVEARPSALLRSDDGGNSWRTISNEPGISPRPMYFSDIRVDPLNENRLYRVGDAIDVSEDQGRTFRETVPSSVIHGDIHDLWINPRDPRHLIQANDGGLGISLDRGDRWRQVQNLPLAQFYQMTVDDQYPFHIYGGVQDSGSWEGPSWVWESRGIISPHFRRVGTGDGFAVLPDKSNKRFLYNTRNDGSVTRYDRLTGEHRSIEPPVPPGDTLRYNWNTAMAVDPHDSATVYYGSQYVHRSRDGGRTWETISPDLTTDDPRKQRPTPIGTPAGTEGDQNNSILSIEVSPSEPNVIWVTTDDGNIQITRNGGQTWQNTGSRLPGAPDSAYVPEIKPSRHVPGRAYAVVDDHRTGDQKAYLYVTEAYGERWAQLPTSAGMAFAHEIEEDPVDPNLLFMGTELGLWVSLDRGQSWFKWRSGLPEGVPVREVVVHPIYHDVAIGTHGRAFWVIDDVRPLRELAATPAIRTRPLHMFTPPPAQQHVVAAENDLGIHIGYRVVGHDMFFGENKPYGAMLSYWVSGAAVGQAATVEIRNAQGQVLRNLPGTSTAGVNRVVWDLHPNTPPRPAGAPGGGGGGGGFGGNQPPPEVAPGQYTAVVRVGTQEVTGTIQVLGDPRDPGPNFFNPR